MSCLSKHKESPKDRAFIIADGLNRRRWIASLKLKKPQRGSTTGNPIIIYGEDGGNIKKVRWKRSTIKIPSHELRYPTIAYHYQHQKSITYKNSISETFSTYFTLSLYYPIEQALWGFLLLNRAAVSSILTMRFIPDGLKTAGYCLKQGLGEPKVHKNVSIGQFT